MAQQSKLSIPLTLEMNRDTYNKLAVAKKTEGNDALTGYALATICNQFLDAYANGGLIIKPENMKALELACNARISTEMQLVSEVQKAQKRDEGQNVITVKVDDSIFPAIQEYATTIGMSVQEVMDDLAHRIVRDSLTFYINNQNYAPVVYLTEDQGRRLEKIVGKKFITGDDILAVAERKELAAV